MEKAGLHARKGEFADAPVFDELPFCLECKLVSFDPKTGCTVGEILNISAAEAILGADGKVSLEKFRPIIYDPVHHNYHTMGAVAGKAFCDGKKISE